MNLDQLVAQTVASPSKNLSGLFGPQCPMCSGLGQILGMRVGELIRHTSQCKCHGSGLDIEKIERTDRDLLWQQIHAIESRLGLPLTSRYNYPNIKASRQYWTECIQWITTDATAVASSVTETVIVPNVVIPAGYMQDGRLIRLKVAGRYSTLGSGTVTHVYKVKYNGVGGTVIAQSGTVTLLISMTNAYWEMEVMIQTRSNGSSGTLLGDGVAKAFGGTAPTIGSATGAPAIAPMTAGGQTAPAVATVDLTVDWPLAVTLTHGANSASNTAQGQHYSLESLN